MQKNILFIICLLACAGSGFAQSSYTIPAYTAYAVPAEATDTSGNSILFEEKTGLHNWTDARQTIHFFFKIRNKGSLTLSLLAKNKTAGNQLTASIAGRQFIIPVPAGSKFVKVKVGNVQLNDTGFYELTLAARTKKGAGIADIRELILSGDAAKNIHYNPVSRRNAASVHLLYPLDDSMKVVSFYNEVTVPAGSDLVNSYFMACGFSRGYFGMQVNGPSERRIIFSVWDAGNEEADRNKVAAENRVQLAAKGEEIVATDFGNEGTGGHSHWLYDWKAGATYKFLVTAATDSAAATTSYAGYFFIPETQRWKLIACFRAPKDGKPLRKLYSFVENFDGSNGQFFRKAFFGNQWIRRESGEWKEIIHSSFSYDATAKAGDRIDYGTGLDSNRFVLWNGGFREKAGNYGDPLTRNATGTKPAIDFYKQADSAITAVKEREVIIAAIRNGQIDTTGSSNGVFYKILREGNGDAPTLADTVVVHYKGTLLNGFVFDETKEKTASFPLKRLIKGWQAGLPFCRQGGQIRLIIPSYLAYSIRNLGDIPPNSILIFDIELVQVLKGR